MRDTPALYTGRNHHSKARRIPSGKTLESTLHQGRHTHTYPARTVLRHTRARRAMWMPDIHAGIIATQTVRAESGTNTALTEPGRQQNRVF
jgi:hypothetical protein